MIPALGGRFPTGRRVRGVSASGAAAVAAVASGACGERQRAESAGFEQRKLWFLLEKMSFD